jgi:hypothetical protein
VPAEPVHLCDRDGAEVDLVLESGDGRVVGGEVKGGVTVRAEDVGGLRLLERRLGADFVAGLVLCTAPEPRHLGGRLWIMPCLRCGSGSRVLIGRQETAGNWSQRGVESSTSRRVPSPPPRRSSPAVCSCRHTVG